MKDYSEQICNHTHAAGDMLYCRRQLCAGVAYPFHDREPLRVLLTDCLALIDSYDANAQWSMFRGFLDAIQVPPEHRPLTPDQCVPWIQANNLFPEWLAYVTDRRKQVATRIHQLLNDSKVL